MPATLLAFFLDCKFVSQNQNGTISEKQKATLN